MRAAPLPAQWAIVKGLFGRREGGTLFLDESGICPRRYGCEAAAGVTGQVEALWAAIAILISMCGYFRDAPRSAEGDGAGRI